MSDKPASPARGRKKTAPPAQQPPQEEVVVRLPLTDLHPFPDHPFQVRDDEEMRETIQSVKEYGVIVPAIVRPREEGGYETLVTDSEMWRAYFNTFLYVVPTTLLMLFTCVLAAYPLTYKNLRGRKYINMFLLIPMYFSGGMIPSFLLITKLGLYDNPWSQILPACYSIWNIILVKSFFGTIPETLREAAKIDGANVYQVLLKVYLPLSSPILAVIAVYTIVGMWNSWFNALVYLPHTDWQPLQLYLRRVLVENTQNLSTTLDPDTAREMALRNLSNAQLKYAMIIFTTAPMLVVYPFFQKYFVKGVMLGSLKE